MELGLIYSDANSVPPNQKAWAMNGYCPSQCTKNVSRLNKFTENI